MDKEQAIHNFWNSFGIPAYDETTVPDSAVFPYITYSMATDSIGNVVPISLNIYYRSNSWRDVTLKSEEIAKRIKENGYEMITFDKGYIYLTGGTPFAQRVAIDEDRAIKRIYMNILAEFLCEY